VHAFHGFSPPATRSLLSSPRRDPPLGQRERGAGAAVAKGEGKEAVARPLLEAAEREGVAGTVVLVGIAQEKTPVWRSWKAKGQEHLPHPHMEWGRLMAVVSHFYLYLPAGHGVGRGVLQDPALMRRGRCGSGSMGTPGRSASATRSGSATPRRTTAFATACQLHRPRGALVGGLSARSELAIAWRRDRP
jgi:hypothetical protein